MFGRFFPSAWSMPISGQDIRFFPKTTLQWLAYPFFWLQGAPFVASELKLRDPRFALAYVAIACAFAGLMRERRPTRQAIALWLFGISGYVIWLFGFSILRYALPLEALSGVFIATTFQTILPARELRWTLALLAVFCLAFTKPMGWGRIGYGKSLVSAPIPILPTGTLLLVQGNPIGFVLPYLVPAPAHIVRLENLFATSPEWPILIKIMNQHPPIWLLTNERIAHDNALNVKLSSLSLHITGASCLPLVSSVQKTIELCPLTKAP
jgi:hypothetical protein